jgi:TorA maturation chaperone TorD
VPTLSPEEAARANFYGLLARLFHAAPDAALLAAIAGAGKIDAIDGVLRDAWLSLAHVAAVTDAETVREEYESTYVGTGKAPVTPYTTAYTIRYANAAPLSALRAHLAALGLSRRESSHEPEDHISALCETMRYLIAEQQLGLSEQRRFFDRWIAPASDPLCDAVSTAPSSTFYEHVGRLAKAFFQLERSAFAMS